MFITSKDTD